MGWDGPVTHRQLLAWDAWIDGEWERPSLLLDYLRLIATETRRSYAEKPKDVSMDHLQLKPATPATAVSEEHQTAIAKARWAGILGARKEVAK